MAFPPISSQGGATTPITPSPQLAGASRRVTASGYMTPADNVVTVDASSGPVNMTLPTAASAYTSGVGNIFTLKKVDASANGVTLSAQTGEMIDGYSHVDAMTQYETVTVQSNGVSYDVLSRGY